MPYTTLSVLLSLLYLRWPEVLVNGVIGVVYTCHFKSGSNVTGLRLPSDTSSIYGVLGNCCRSQHSLLHFLRGSFY